MPLDGPFADRKRPGYFFYGESIHIIQTANPARRHGQLHQVYVNVCGRKLFQWIFLRHKPHSILDLHVVERLCFPVAEHGERGVADSGVHPVEKLAFYRIVLINVREHFQHPVVDRRDDVVFVLKKVLAKREQDRVKLPVQFFLTLALPPSATRQYLV